MPSRYRRKRSSQCVRRRRSEQPGPHPTLKTGKPPGISFTFNQDGSVEVTGLPFHQDYEARRAWLLAWLEDGVRQELKRLVRGGNWGIAATEEDRIESVLQTIKHM